MRSIVLLLALVACKPDADPVEDTGTHTGDIDTGDTADTDTGDTDTGDTDTGDTDTGDTDTGDTDDTGWNDTGDTDDTGDTGEDTGVDTGDTDDTGDDTGVDTGDTGDDTGDTGVDTGDTDDTGEDTGDTDDTAVDTGDDTGVIVDTGVDTGEDTAVDTGEDTAVDTGEDTAVDTGEDTAVDTGEDTAVDTGEDTAVDTGVVVDTGADTADSGDVVVDADLDGFDASADCDDGDASVYPGAAEVCDGVDQDCDLAVDEDATDAATWYLDLDEDGAGDATVTLAACEAPVGYAAAGDDCDDADAAYHPAAVEDDCTDPNDYNCDGSVAYADADGDGFAACEECDDADDAVFPGADELCNGVDDDCDGAVDPDDALDAETWYADADLDGHGDPAAATLACAVPDGAVADDEDCDDTDAAVSPSATETCNDVDDDCDGTTDEPDAADAASWHADADLDGYGDAGVAETACDAPAGYVADATDCDDASASVSPAGLETCDDVDNDCDGLADEGAADATTWFRDADADGFGDAASGALACDPEAGWVGNDDDCADAVATVFPGAPETCNDVDDDCDGTPDDEAVDPGTWYADVDGDGFGDAGVASLACDAPTGTVAVAGDCDDTTGAVSPTAGETCNDVDDDCDGAVDEDATDRSTWYADVDGDGYGNASATTIACDAPTGAVAMAGDCDDTTAAVSPTGTETCNDADDDCDGLVDEDATDPSTWYADVDGDGYGDAGATTTACDAPAGAVAVAGDCDDTSGAVSPSAAETCNDVDDDCDGVADDGAADASTAWYADVDGDGYGDPATGTVACDAPAGTVANDDDCNDADGSAHLGGTEVRGDGIDQDCDGSDLPGLTIDWCNVQWPTSTSTTPGVATGAVYGQVWVDGVTSGTGAGADIVAELGYGRMGTDPSAGAAWTWTSGTFNVDVGSNDEYQAQLSIANAGYYLYAWRFSGDGGRSWTYCDTSGTSPTDPFDTSVAGVVRVGADNDGDGAVSVADGGGDCDDANATVNPRAAEVCGDGIDNNCDAAIDDAAASDAGDWYADADLDGYGDADVGTTACEAPIGYVADASDCDDTTAAVSPDGVEVCDGLDNECDGSVDDNATDAATWYADVDADGYGAGAASSTCTLPTGASLLAGDCDDADAAEFPGAEETCDGSDDDCDGAVDEPGATGGGTWYADVDGDGYGDASDAYSGCSQPAGYVTDGTDCDDEDLAQNPGASEVDGNGVDEDCDGADYVLYDLGDVPVGGFVISEVMPNPNLTADPIGEWIEVYNATAMYVDVNGLKIADNTANSTIASTLVLEPGGYLVLAQTLDASTNGGFAGVDFDYQNGIQLGNSGDTLTVAYGTTTFDTVVYATGWPFAAGVAMSLSSDLLDATSNDSSASWCQATSIFATGEKGTPGDANADCTP